LRKTAAKEGIGNVANNSREGLNNKTGVRVMTEDSRKIIAPVLRNALRKTGHKVTGLHNRAAISSDLLKTGMDKGKRLVRLKTGKQSPGNRRLSKTGVTNQNRINQAGHHKGDLKTVAITISLLKNRREIDMECCKVLSV